MIIPAKTGTMKNLCNYLAFSERAVSNTVSYFQVLFVKVFELTVETNVLISTSHILILK